MATKKTAAVDTAETASVQEAAPVTIADPRPVKASVSDAGFCAYIGPTINGVIQSGTIYSGSKSDALKSAALAVEKYPLVSALIVSGDTLSVDRVKVKTPGNLLYVNYMKLASGKNK